MERSLALRNSPCVRWRRYPDRVTSGIDEMSTSSPDSGFSGRLKLGMEAIAQFQPCDGGFLSARFYGESGARVSLPDPRKARQRSTAQPSRVQKDSRAGKACQ